MRVEARAKTSDTPHSIWVQGEYITEPPIRPADGKKRPAGHYIDKGGYPGANVYEVSIETLCMDTGAVDGRKHRIFERDILLYETEREIGYFIMQDRETAVDIVNGEIVGIADLQAEDIKVIGSMIDFPDFVEGIRNCIDTEREIPYLPALDIMETPYPFLSLTCLKCGYTTWAGKYIARHKDCGGILHSGFCKQGIQERRAKRKGVRIG